MEIDYNEENIFFILTSNSWDSRKGQKMVFLKNRYYVYDDEHLLLDGGIVSYDQDSKTMKIRNEDLRGEICLSLKDKNILHLKGWVLSKSAGHIIIDTLLYKYDKKLRAPLSRVARVERYLRPNEIYENLLNEKAT